jgi:hypothetical protein
VGLGCLVGLIGALSRPRFAGNVALFRSFSMLGRMLLFPIMLVFMYFYHSYIGSIEVI